MTPMDLSTIPRSVQWRIQLGVYQSIDPSGLEVLSETEMLELIYQANKDVIQRQHERFQGLVEKYVEIELEDVPSPEKAAPPQDVEVDPLTAMVMEQQALEMRKAELLLKYKKERARRKRGLTTEGHHIGDENDGIDRASVSAEVWLVQLLHL